MRELRLYLDGLNAKYNYDLAAEWYGEDDEPVIRVYEEADDHTLTMGTPANILEHVREALPHWGWETE